MLVLLTSNECNTRSALKTPLCHPLIYNCLFWFNIIYYVSISASENSFLCLSDRISHMGNVFVGVLNTRLRWKRHQITFINTSDCIALIRKNTLNTLTNEGQREEAAASWTTLVWLNPSPYQAEWNQPPSGRIPFHLLVCTIFWWLTKACDSVRASDLRLTCKLSSTLRLSSAVHHTKPVPLQ